MVALNVAWNLYMYLHTYIYSFCYIGIWQKLLFANHVVTYKIDIFYVNDIVFGIIAEPFSKEIMRYSVDKKNAGIST